MNHRCIYDDDTHHTCRCKCGAICSKRFNETHPTWETEGSCLGELIWLEDECTRHDPDAEGEHQAYARLTGRVLKDDMAARDKSKDADWRDAFGYFLPGGYTVVHSYDGACIYKAHAIND
jgi:hypothetical protein